MTESLTREQSSRIRKLFQVCEYTDEGLESINGSWAPPAPGEHRFNEIMAATASSSDQSLLIRLFYLGVSVDAAIARQNFPGWFIDCGLQCGLLADQGDRLEPQLLLVPCEGLYVASDRYLADGGLGGEDHVLAVNETARHLLNFMVRDKVDSTLDLCCGSGILSLVAARNSRTVVGTDLNAKALEMARLNALLNDNLHIEWHTGNLFEPVADRQFEQIVCNPPFMIAPSREYLFCDSDQELDGLSRDIIQAAPKYLTDGGIFQMLFEWVELDSQPWRERLSDWFHELECDVWVLAANHQSTAGYVQSKRRGLDRNVADGSQSGMAADWQQYFDKHRVTRIHGGLVTMRRRSGPNWMYFDELKRSVDEPVGSAIRRGISCRDFLADHASDEKLLKSKPRLCESVRMEQLSRRVGTAWQVESITLTQKPGLPHTLGVDAVMFQFLSQFDGVRTVAEISEELASANGIDIQKTREESLAAIRQLMEAGYLSGTELS